MEDEQHLGTQELTKLLEGAGRLADSEMTLAEIHPHLAICPACREQFAKLDTMGDQYKVAMSTESVPKTADCPAAEVWIQVAGGVEDAEQTLRYVEHASGCDHCGPLLRAAVGEVADLSRALTDDERKLIANLESAGPEWQMRLAERIAGTSLREQKSESWWRRWAGVPALAATGTAIVVVAGMAWWVLAGRSSPDSANRLLARAYSDQRTLELRIPGAAYAPLRVQRGPAESFIARPAPLLKAEAMIGSQLASHPDDPTWLQAAARADVLEGKYDAAVESLQRAVELRPDSPELLGDLGIAYFQRARSEDRPEDYGASFEYLSKVLAAQPDNTTALFNRAIVAEHQYLYQQALDDWEHYLKLDSSSEWADEARNHAEAVRAKLREHESRARPLLSPEQVANARDGDVDRRVEQYLDAAVQSWLPGAYPANRSAGDAHAQQALFFFGGLNYSKT